MYRIHFDSTFIQYDNFTLEGALDDYLSFHDSNITKIEKGYKADCNVEKINNFAEIVSCETDIAYVYYNERSDLWMVNYEVGLKEFSEHQDAIDFAISWVRNYRIVWGEINVKI